jgi:hypothetical protein
LRFSKGSRTPSEMYTHTSQFLENKFQIIAIISVGSLPVLSLKPLKDIVVFRFIIEYSSLRDFYRPLGNNNNNNNRSIFILRGFLKGDNFGLC